MLDKKINQFIIINDLKTRPNAGPGVWLMFLLPLSIILTFIRQSVIITTTYKLSTLVSFGLLLNCCQFLYEINNNRKLKFYSKWSILNSLLIAFLFHLCFHRGFLFCLWSGICSTIIYQEFYLFVLKHLPHCFTLGEAAICCQSFIIFIYSTFVNCYNSFIKTPNGIVQISTTIIQQGLTAIAVIILLLYIFKIRKPLIFYSVTFTILFSDIFIFLQILIQRNPIVWVVEQMVYDFFDMKVIPFWLICCLLAVFAVSYQIKKAKKATTVTRKIFHILAICVFISGLLYNCSFLYLSSGVVFGVFLMLELLRILKIPPLYEYLQNGLIVYGDEKDCGIIVLTPIYLLVGCSLPLWLHPSPCDLTNSTIFNRLPLLSGILTIGIGDTTASFIGYYYGKHKWMNSMKSIEGTLSCIISQCLIVYLFIYFGFLKLQIFDSIRVILGIVTTSIIEAKTDQIDNLILPLVMYIILI